MMRARALDAPGDFCCLPSPHRVPQGVAGMAFNFSMIELSRYAAQRSAPRQDEAQRGPTQSTRARTRKSRFGVPHYSPAT